MPRPKSPRCIDAFPDQTWFKPAGISLRDLSEVVLELDELEAIRLSDLEGLYQEDAAEKMNVSRQTLGRILQSAHRKIAEALVKGKAIRLKGGAVEIMDDQKEPIETGKGASRGVGPGRGQRIGRGSGSGQGQAAGKGKGRGQGGGRCDGQGQGAGRGQGRGGRGRGNK